MKAGLSPSSRLTRPGKKTVFRKFQSDQGEQGGQEEPIDFWKAASYDQSSLEQLREAPDLGH